MAASGGGASLTLRDRLAIALVPSSVPALVLLIALGLAISIGELPEAMDAAFEQIAGGALLITYIKELFPKVMEQADVAVEHLAVKGDSRSLMRTKVGCTLLMVGCISASAVAQAGAAGFPGIEAGGNHSDAAAEAAEPTFTPLSTIAYFVGFFVDGVVLAYDDAPVRCDLSLVKKMVMSLVFAIDNLLDGFGLVPVLKEAYGEDDWWIVMVIFSGCVLAGATFTALLRHYAPSPLLHLMWISLATTSILVGALQLTPHGLSVYVVVGVAIVWIVLFIGDLVSEEGGGEGDAEAATLANARAVRFRAAIKPTKAVARWRSANRALAFARAVSGESLTAQPMVTEHPVQPSGALQEPLNVGYTPPPSQPPQTQPQQAQPQ